MKRLAQEIHTQTLVGADTNFPGKYGNCFSVGDDAGNTYNIVNFTVENLQELVARGTLSWPIEIEIIDGAKTAIVNDDRIPDEWYDKRFCRRCCAQELMPTSPEQHDIIAMEEPIRVNFSQAEVNERFEKLVTHLKENKVPGLKEPRVADAGEFMLMHEGRRALHFKHRNTRYYLHLVKAPTGGGCVIEKDAFFE